MKVVEVVLATADIVVQLMGVLAILYIAVAVVCRAVMDIPLQRMMHPGWIQVWNEYSTFKVVAHDLYFINPRDREDWEFSEWVESGDGEYSLYRHWLVRRDHKKKTQFTYYLERNGRFVKCKNLEEVATRLGVYDEALHWVQWENIVFDPRPPRRGIEAPILDVIREWKGKE